MGESTTAKVVADLVTEHIAPSLLTVEATDGASAPVLVLPKGLEAHSVKRLVDEHRSQPERRVGTARLGDLDSFVAHAVRFKGASSALFANPSPTSPSLTAVFDYHPMGAEGARFCQHRSVYAFPVSEEWQAWTALAGKPMSQEAFALLIENRIVDVADPAGVGETAKAFASTIGCDFASPSRLLDLSRGLSIRVSSKVAKSVNLATGETQLQYAEGHTGEDGAPLKVPGAFLLAIPVYKAGALYQVPARLRYRVSGGSVAWSVDLWGADRVFDHAFREACSAAEERTGLPLFVGSPES